MSARVDLAQLKPTTEMEGFYPQNPNENGLTRAYKIRAKTMIMKVRPILLLYFP